MEAAKAAVSKFTSNRGHHTTVEETVNPHVTRETIKPLRHEEATQAVDREVHQHHYHTTVQPLSHQERLPEKHTHNILPTEHREYRHDNEERTKAKLAAELGHFKDTRSVEQTHHTKAAAPSVTGEHVHHHVHETVVPVVHKETIQPEVVHTTVPVHETHHAAAQHHGLSALPMKTLDEFKKVGGSLSGGRHGSHEEYEGQPRQYNEKLSTTFEQLGLAGTGARHHQTDSGVSGVSGVGGVGDNRSNRGTGVDAVSGSQSRLGNDAKDYGDNRSTQGSGLTGNGGRANSTSSSLGNTNTRTKPSLMDRLNPRKDTDGDGKAGIDD